MDNNTDNPRKTNGHKKSRKKKKLRVKRIIFTLLAAFFIIGLISAIGVGIWVLDIASTLPDISTEDLLTLQTSFVYDGEDVNYASLYGSENRVSVSLSEMPQYLQDLVVANEDARFYEHFGVDIWRIGGALIADIKTRSRSQGASTITMQLTRNAILETQEKKLTRKIKEALLAIKIEQYYSKDEILELYLNEVHFGHGTYGVQAASKYYFDKDVSELTLGEAAMLIGILPSPGNYSPFDDYDTAVNMRDKALNELVKYKPEYQSQIDTAKQETLVAKKGNVGTNYQYPWFTDAVLDESEAILEDMGLDTMLIYTGGLHIYTTLDTKVQSKMEELYADPANFPESSTGDLVESSMVVIEQSTGEIKGLIGGREYLTKRGYNRATDLQRQPGSTIKPIAVYGPALESGYSPASVMDDCPTTFGTNYTPNNYDGKYRGLISMRTAIMYSVNIPAVKFMKAISPETGLEYAIKAGLPLSGENDANLALALGGITDGVSTEDMTEAYATIANAGIHTDSYLIRKIVDHSGNTIYETNPERETVFSAQSAYLLTDMMISVTQSGTGTKARMNRPVASKTGTTQLPDTKDFKNIRLGNKDAWFAAFTPELTAVVWMGYDNDKDSDGNIQYLKQIYGGKYPALLWKQVMTTALEDVPVTTFTNPGGIVSLSIDKKSGMLPSSLTPAEYLGSEIFYKGNVPTKESDIWEAVTLCPESGKLAGPYCPNPVTKVKLKPSTEPNANYLKSADAALYAPTETCPIHTVPTFNNDNSDNDNDNNNGNGNGNGNGNDNDENPFTPSDLEATYDDNDGTLTAYISWEDNNEPGKTLYVVEKITDGDNETRVKFNTYSRYYEDTDIESGHSYRYRVYAYDEDTKNVSNWSKTVTINP